MKKIEDLVAIYDQGHNHTLNIILHIIGILCIYFGLIGMLWLVPDALIKGWMGDREFANWATVFAMLLLVYYGSESFSLTFAMGALLLGCLLLTQKLQAIQPAFFMEINVALFSGGILLQALGHMIEGNRSAFKRDISFVFLMPAWMFSLAYSRFGIPL
ncbi:MAG: DUF962 domain-containing protein [Cyclobacteriaceae bacterium]|nr:DUF962 domain-containing protein [Cyclobacteriaceae bacterium]